MGHDILGAQRCRRSISTLYVKLGGLFREMACLRDRQVFPVKIEMDHANLIKMMKNLSDWPVSLGVRLFIYPYEVF